MIHNAEDGPVAQKRIRAASLALSTSDKAAAAIFVTPLGSCKAVLDKEQELGAFLADAQRLVAHENGTISWFAYHVDDQTFGICDSLDDETGRQARLDGPVAAALVGCAAELLAEHLDIRPVDILAEKLPG
jgi:hypothetical protein